MKRSKYTAHACIYMYMYIATAPNETKVQTLGTVTCAAQQAQTHYDVVMMHGSVVLRA